MEEKLFFHECRAAGKVFKTCEEWIAYVQEHKQIGSEVVAEHDGFQYNVNDVCINPNVRASYKIDNYCNWQVKTAKTQYGWIWGYDISLKESGSSCGAAYPSRYDNSAQFFETEDDALIDALSFIIRQLEGKKSKTKNVNILLWAAKNQRMDIKHQQLDLFSNQKL